MSQKHFTGVYVLSLLSGPLPPVKESAAVRRRLLNLDDFVEHALFPPPPAHTFAKASSLCPGTRPSSKKRQSRKQQQATGGGVLQRGGDRGRDSSGKRGPKAARRKDGRRRLEGSQKSWQSSGGARWDRGDSPTRTEGESRYDPHMESGAPTGFGVMSTSTAAHIARTPVPEEEGDVKESDTPSRRRRADDCDEDAERDDEDDSQGSDLDNDSDDDEEDDSDSMNESEDASEGEGRAPMSGKENAEGCEGGNGGASIVVRGDANALGDNVLLDVNDDDDDDDENIVYRPAFSALAQTHNHQHDMVSNVEGRGTEQEGLTHIVDREAVNFLAALHEKNTSVDGWLSSGSASALPGGGSSSTSTGPPELTYLAGLFGSRVPEYDVRHGVDGGGSKTAVHHLHSSIECSWGMERGERYDTDAWIGRPATTETVPLQGVGTSTRRNGHFATADIYGAPPGFSAVPPTPFSAGTLVQQGIHNVTDWIPHGSHEFDRGPSPLLGRLSEKRGGATG